MPASPIKSRDAKSLAPASDVVESPKTGPKPQSRISGTPPVSPLAVDSFLAPSPARLESKADQPDDDVFDVCAKLRLRESEAADRLRAIQDELWTAEDVLALTPKGSWRPVTLLGVTNAGACTAWCHSDVEIAGYEAYLRSEDGIFTYDLPIDVLEAVDDGQYLGPTSALLAAARGLRAAYDEAAAALHRIDEHPVDRAYAATIVKVEEDDCAPMRLLAVESPLTLTLLCQAEWRMPRLERMGLIRLVPMDGPASTGECRYSVPAQHLGRVRSLLEPGMSYAKDSKRAGKAPFVRPLDPRLVARTASGITCVIDGTTYSRSGQAEASGRFLVTPSRAPSKLPQGVERIADQLWIDKRDWWEYVETGRIDRKGREAADHSQLEAPESPAGPAVGQGPSRDAKSGEAFASRAFASGPARPVVDLFPGEAILKLGASYRETLERATDLLKALKEHPPVPEVRVIVEGVMEGESRRQLVALAGVKNPASLNVIVKGEDGGEFEVPLDCVHQVPGRDVPEVAAMAWRLRATRQRTQQLFQRYEGVRLDEAVRPTPKQYRDLGDQHDLRVVGIASPTDEALLCRANGQLGLSALREVPRPEDMPSGHYYWIPPYFLEARAG